jgi:hypothetical protein
MRVVYDAIQIDQLHGAASVGSPTFQNHRSSFSGLSPLTRPHEISQSGLAIFGSSPPAQPLGPPSIGYARAEASQAAPIPQTTNPTPRDTPDLTAQGGGHEVQGYYSSRGECW